jgi:hypothetical protein
MTDRRSVLRGLLLAAVSRRVQAALPSWARDRLLQEGETALMRGDVERAMQAFEQAGAMGHDPAIELGLVRAAMQAGRYRQAQGFAAHTAGEHGSDAACVAAHLWLLQLGGQAALAAQTSEQAMPLLTPSGRALVDEAMRQWQRGWPQASAVQAGMLMRAPWRLAPYAHGEPIPDRARTVCSGTLLPGADGAQRVAVPVEIADAFAAGEARRWWVRNGLGHTVPATLEGLAADAPHASDAGTQPVRLLRLQGQPLPGHAMWAGRDAFPGSPAYAVSYATDAQDTLAATPSEAARATAGWPVMRMGFAGRVDAKLGRLLGVEGPHGPWSQADGALNPLGGPVWDARGQLIGLALPAAQGAGPDRMWPVSAMRRTGWFASVSTTPPMLVAASMPLDAIYAQSMQLCVQVIAA